MPSGRSLRCRCPKCRHELTLVLASNEDEGMIVRRRKCLACDHRWYTLQEPEYVVKAEKVAYRDKRMAVRQ